MIENVTTPCGSGYFQPPPLIDLPLNLPEGADYKPYLFELIHRHGRAVFDNWVDDRVGGWREFVNGHVEYVGGYRQEFEALFKKCRTGWAPSNQREFELYQKYPDFVGKAFPGQSDIKGVPYTSEFLTGYKEWKAR